MNINFKLQVNQHKYIPKRQVNFCDSNSSIQYKKNADFDTIEINGTHTKAKVFSPSLDFKTYDQIKIICSHPVFKDLPIRIMPDVHPSRNTVVGFSSPMSQVGVIPGIIGDDIGCGMLCVQFDTQGKDIDFEKLDTIVKEITSCERAKEPFAFKKIPHSFKKDIRDLCKGLKSASADFHQSRLGTLGRGNHFIEIDKDDFGEYYLIIHTGSRSLGEKVAQKYDHLARLQHHYYIKGLSYLTGDEAKEYIKDMRLVQKYAEVNRQIIADEILYRMGWKKKASFESVHNYVGDDNIIRKGAIKADKDERVIIPLNMRDGAIIAKGKGNKDWNNTAPHGAGRKYTRKDAKNVLSYESYINAMQGIYSTSVKPETIDEAPMAYKDSDEIIGSISDTVAIDGIVRPIYNYKEG